MAASLDLSCAFSVSSALILRLRRCMSRASMEAPAPELWVELLPSSTAAPAAESASCRFQMQRVPQYLARLRPRMAQSVCHSSMSQLAVNDIQPGRQVPILQQ